jgi:hypothetical protein
MSSTTSTRKTVVSTRLEPALKERLRELAIAEDRSISTEVRRAVVAHVKHCQPDRPSRAQLPVTAKS